MAKHGLIELLDGYSTVSRDEEQVPGGKYFISKAISGRMVKRKGADTSFSLFGLLEKLEDVIMYTTTRSYGFMALTFGILTIILHFAGDFFIESMNASITSIIIGALSALVAVPLLFSNVSLSVQLQDIPLTRWLLYDFLCLKRTNRSDDKTGIPTFILVIFGVTLAAVGFFVPVKYLVSGVFVAVFLHLAFQSPEFSAVATFLVLPYVSLAPFGQYAFVSLIAVTVLSFFRKTARGKRVFFFEQYDIVVLLLIAVTVVSGLVMNPRADFSLVLAAVPFLGYLIGSNLTTNKRVADCAMSAIAASSVPAAVIAMIRFVMAVSRGEVPEFFKRAEPSVFNTAAAFSVYLTVSALFCIFFIKERRAASILYIFVLAADIIALVLAACPLTALIIALCFAVFRFFPSSRVGGSVTVGLGALLYLLYLIPENALNFIFRGNGTLTGKELILLKLESVEVFLDNLLLGVGAGKESVTEELTRRGFFSPDFGNIFLELACESGVFALLLFILFICIRVRHSYVYFHYLRSVGQINYFTAMEVVSFAVIGLGIFCGIFSEPTLAFITWFVFGMGSAMLRISKREVDDRYVDFRDHRSLDSSEMEIEIRNF